VETTTSAVAIDDGDPPLVIAITGTLDALVAAELEAAMAEVRSDPRDVVFDVSGTDRLDVEGILVLAEHAHWLRSRSCSARLRGAPATSEQLARLLGYEVVLGLG
jgi:anti-anti-sigma regulatory factor